MDCLHHLREPVGGVGDVLAPCCESPEESSSRNILLGDHIRAMLRQWQSMIEKNLNRTLDIIQGRKIMIDA